MNIINKLVLGTAQFGMDYGVANLSGKPTKKEVFAIFELAWDNGIRRFDTAPGYGSEALLGEFISTEKLQDEVILFTKIPPLSSLDHYKQFISSSLGVSLENLGCAVNTLLFQGQLNAGLLLEDPQFFRNLLSDYSVGNLGISVYDVGEVENLSTCEFDLSFQFPFNVLDRRFERVKMQRGGRYARSVFLQGLLASPNRLRLDTPERLRDLQEMYHGKLADNCLDPVAACVTFVARNQLVDYFLIGVDSEKQLQDIFDSAPYSDKEMAMLDTVAIGIDQKLLDPRNWS